MKIPYQWSVENFIKIPQRGYSILNKNKTADMSENKRFLYLKFIKFKKMIIFADLI